MKLLLVLVFGIVSTSFSCEHVKKPPRDEKVLNIQRILMHEPRHFTVLVQDSNTNIIKGRDIEVSGDDIVYIPDVGESGTNWAVLHWDYLQENNYYHSVIKVTFHIKSPEIINGAGWNHGKFGSGQTEVVQ